MSDPRRWWIAEIYEDAFVACDTYREALSEAWRGDPNNVHEVIKSKAYDELKKDRDALRAALEDMGFHTSCGACEENHKIRAEALEKSKGE